MTPLLAVAFGVLALGFVYLMTMSWSDGQTIRQLRERLKREDRQRITLVASEAYSAKAFAELWQTHGKPERAAESEARATRVLGCFHQLIAEYVDLYGQSPLSHDERQAIIDAERVKVFGFVADAEPRAPSPESLL